MKKIMSMFILMISLLVLVGCGEDEGFFEEEDLSPEAVLIETNVSHKLIDFETGEEVMENQLTVGTEYRLYMDFDFDDLKKTLKKGLFSHDKISVTVTVRLGELDNEENKNYWESREMGNGGGYNFSHKGDGVYTATFLLDKNFKPDELFFILKLPQMLDDPIVPRGIVVSFVTDTKYQFKIGNSSIYKVSLFVFKANYNFDESNIEKVQGGDQAGEYNYEIEVPTASPELTITVYNDENDTLLRIGTHSFNYEQENDDDFKWYIDENNILKINFREFVEKFNFKFNSNGEKQELRFEITAHGTKNYNEKNVSVIISFEGTQLP